MEAFGIQFLQGCFFRSGTPKFWGGNTQPLQAEGPQLGFDLKGSAGLPFKQCVKTLSR